MKLGESKGLEGRESKNGSEAKWFLLPGRLLT